MKLTQSIVMLIALLFSVSAMADVQVNGYYKDNGTYVEPHYRSSPNSTSNDNWSTQGNVNPYTGQEGYKKPDYNSQNSSAW